MIKVLAPIMLPKATSAQLGRLEYDAEINKLTFIKSKAQASGRVDLVTWLVITVSRVFRKDKVLFTIDKSEILNIEHKPSTSSLKYSELNISTNDKVYKFKYNELPEEKVAAFAKEIKQ